MTTQHALRMAAVLSLAVLGLAGATRTAAAQVEPLAGSPTQGKWTGSFPWPHVAIHTHLLPNGRVLTWGREAQDAEPGEGIAPAAVWDPSTKTFADVTYSTTDLFCTGHSFLPDGRLLVSGGHVVDGVGKTDTNLFDSATNTWTAGAPMTGGRWYPTSTSLGNGEVLIVSGANESGNNTLPQVRMTSGAWRDLTSARLGMPLYPYMHLAPDGRVFNSGPQTGSRFLATSGTGAWSAGPTSQWGYRDYGTSVMYQPGKVLVAGGGNPPTNTAEVIDLNQPVPAWRFTSPMASARRMLNATLLADGKVLVTGGTSSGGFNHASGAVLAAEIWDPATEAWTTVAPMTVRRLYHSTAILLPDARVLSAGGGRPAASGGDSDHLDAEIFLPPYLFAPDGTRAKRPRILSAPGTVVYGETFFTGTSTPGKIRKVSWIRLSSVTHDFNQEQRHLSLSFLKTGGGLNVTAPSNPNFSPPGHYMLFVVNQAGTPSLARIMRIE